MKEVKLTTEDYLAIHALAHRKFLQAGDHNYERFLTRCLCDSMLEHLAAKGYTVKDGKIYKNN